MSTEQNITYKKSRRTLSTENTSKTMIENQYQH